MTSDNKLEFSGVFLFLQKRSPETDFAGISPTPPSQNSFSEQVSAHLQLIVVVKIPAQFGATTCFRSSVYKLRGAIQDSQPSVSGDER